MKANKTLIFKIVRVIIFIAIIIVSSIMILQTLYASEITLYSIFLISGLVGMFFELYKK